MCPPGDRVNRVREWLVTTGRGWAQVFAGFLLSIVFVQSHNGMEVYSDEKDFITAQVVSTRDITAGVWNDWFTGAPPACEQ